MWDLLVRGGHLLDPANDWNARADVAVHRGRVAAVGPDLPGAASQVVDARGHLVTPGLVDLHTHVWEGGGVWGIDPAAYAWRTGVTTWVDAGSAGAYNLAALRRRLDATPLRVPMLVNVSAIGLMGEVGEHHVLENLDLDAGAAVAAHHGDVVVGVKARIDARTVGPHGLEPLRRAVDLAERIGRPLMVHVGYGPPDIADIVPLLRAGDILTHCASGCTSDMVTDGRLTEHAEAALAAGVHFDLGHGAGAFAFDVLEAELAAGVVPIVSTDLHTRSVQGPAFDLPTVMAKMLAAGVGITDIVEAATIRPARAVGLPEGVGTLGVGAPADLAVFDVQEGSFPVVDVHGQERTAPRRLVNVATFSGGRLLPPRAAEPPPPWTPLSEAQQAAETNRVIETRSAAAPRLGRADDFDQPFPRPGGNP